MGFDPIGFVKDRASDVKDAGEAVIDTTEQVVETGGDVIDGGVDALETAAVKSYQFQSSLTRFGLEKTLEASLFISDKASDVKDKGIELGVRGYFFAKDKIDDAKDLLHDVTHPGDPNPPAAQGLEFSESKGASDLAYNAKEGQTYEFPGGERWKVVEVSEDENSGFRAIALQSTDPNNNRTIVAFAGTDMKSVKDWATDGAQGVGLSTKQYDEAVAFAGKYKEQKGGENVILTGHSLGGGLAAYAAIKHDLHATGINSAPLALNHIGIDVSDHTRITQYYVPGEVLSVVNDKNPFDARPGINIPVQGKNSITDPRSVITNHGLDSVAPDIELPKKVD